MTTPGAASVPGGSGLAASMLVAPEAIPDLKKELQSVHDDIADFLRQRGQALALSPMAADPVSHDVSKAYTDHSNDAVTRSTAYLNELKSVIDQLGKINGTYGSTEEYNTQSLKGQS